MTLSKPTKLLVLLLTILPVIYMVLFFVNIGLTLNSSTKDDLIFKHFGIFMAVHLCVMALMMALLVFYVVFLFKTSRVRPDLKALWAVVLFFGGPIAMPIFWYLYVWKEREPTSD
jgi:hypothetical protein